MSGMWALFGLFAVMAFPLRYIRCINQVAAAPRRMVPMMREMMMAAMVVSDVWWVSGGIWE